MRRHLELIPQVDFQTRHDPAQCGQLAALIPWKLLRRDAIRRAQIAIMSHSGRNQVAIKSQSGRNPVAIKTSVVLSTWVHLSQDEPMEPLSSIFGRVDETPSTG